MTANKLRPHPPKRQPSPRAALAALAALVAAASCNAPISTIRSPYHLRTVEVRNTSDEARTLLIEPTGDQHLGAATTFTGRLSPGEVKVLYLYHGFEYHFRIVDPDNPTELVETTVKVDRDLGLALEGDSLIVDAIGIQVRLGAPSFADSLMQADPFGLRGADPIMPDTSRGRAQSIESDERAERERELEAERARGRIP